MIKLEWLNGRNVWRGECPRCEYGGHYAPRNTDRFSDRTTVDILECSAGHPFVVMTRLHPDPAQRGEVIYAMPITGEINVPSWLPPEYSKTYAEMMFDYKSGQYASAISMASRMLEAHVNSLLKNPGESRKNLKRRLEILVEHGRIDHDQFAEATITRLNRNEVLHPGLLNEEATESDAKDTIDAVSGCLERYYRWKVTKALPAPSEQVSDEMT
jgi:HEPN domain-containing protein